MKNSRPITGSITVPCEIDVTSIRRNRWCPDEVKLLVRFGREPFKSRTLRVGDTLDLSLDVDINGVGR